MWKPDESLDDFVVKAATEELAEPPREVELRFTGEVEVLKPLARWERPAKQVQAIVLTHPSPRGLSWFHRSLAFGGGLAVVALIFASAIFVGMYDPPTNMGVILADAGDPSDLVIDAQPDWSIMPSEEPLSSDVFSLGNSQQADVSTDSSSVFRTRRSASRAFIRPRVKFAAHRVRRQPNRSQLFVSKFFPTTLVIYLENGEIKSRIEPWLTTGF